MADSKGSNIAMDKLTSAVLWDPTQLDRGKGRAVQHGQAELSTSSAAFHRLFKDRIQESAYHVPTKTCSGTKVASPVSAAALALAVARCAGMEVSSSKYMGVVELPLPLLSTSACSMTNSELHKSLRHEACTCP